MAYSRVICLCKAVKCNFEFSVTGSCYIKCRQNLVCFFFCFCFLAGKELFFSEVNLVKCSPENKDYENSKAKYQIYRPNGKFMIDFEGPYMLSEAQTVVSK